LGGELPFEKVGSHPSDIVLAGAVLLRPDRRLQSHLDHQALHRLVIDDMAEPSDRSRHPAIAVTALVGVEDDLTRFRSAACLSVRDNAFCR
jgi:hypothetical protein